MTDRLFEGLLVLDIASFIAAPVATTFLADYGAEVIKVESPAGDGLRALHNGSGMPDTGGRDFAWMIDNRSKKGLCLDLVAPEGQEILRKLVAKADVLVTNFPFPVRRKLKLTYEDVAPLNDRLIYASLTAYGEEGPESDRTGFDSTALYARTGMMDMMRTPGVCAGTLAARDGRSPDGYGAVRRDYDRPLSPREDRQGRPGLHQPDGERHVDERILCPGGCWVARCSCARTVMTRRTPWPTTTAAKMTAGSSWPF